MQQKNLTKRHRKRLQRFKILKLLALSLFVLVFLFAVKSVFRKQSVFISPLAKDQTSIDLKIENELKNKDIPFEYISTAKDLSLIVKLSNNGEVLLSPQKDVLKQISSLQLILTKLKIEGRTFKRLDFRYQKPTITF